MPNKRNLPTEDAQMTFPADNLSLAEHMDLLGLDVAMLYNISKVPVSVIERALKGGHITHHQAKALGEALALKHGAGGSIEPEHIRDLNVWELPAKHQKMQ